MNRSQRAQCAFESLRKIIPAPETELRYTDHWQLLVAVVLSAQCTDVRVNQVTPSLFQQFPNIKSTAAAEPEDVYPWIRSISYPNNKAKHLVGAARLIINEFGGEVPGTVDQLIRLPGVGRKTAQVVASVGFGVPAIAVDTHVFRVANRIGLVQRDATTPEKVETQLKRLLPVESWGEAHHLLILHGRYTCTARKPDCKSCPLSGCCVYGTALLQLPEPLVDLDSKRGNYFCKTRGHYFDDPDQVSDRTEVEQISCPKCGSMNVFVSKTGKTTRRVKDFRV